MHKHISLKFFLSQYIWLSLLLKYSIKIFCYKQKTICYLFITTVNIPKFILQGTTWRGFKWSKQKPQLENVHQINLEY